MYIYIYKGAYTIRTCLLVVALMQCYTTTCCVKVYFKKCVHLLVSMRLFCFTTLIQIVFTGMACPARMFFFSTELSFEVYTKIVLINNGCR